MASAAVNKIERAHQMYREGRHSEALGFYTEALALAKTKPQMIALHSNRAACFLKLHDFNKAAEECTSVLELDHNHSGALMLRAQTLVTLKEYHSALFDVNRLLDLNPSSEVYQNLQARLRTQLSLAPIAESEAELEDEEDYKDESKPNGNEEKEQYKEEENAVVTVGIDQKEFDGTLINADVNVPEMQRPKESYEQEREKSKPTKNSFTAVEIAPKVQSNKELFEQDSKGWQTIPKPKGHSTLDYARWDRVEDNSSEEDDDEEESCPQYKFRVKTIGMRPVK
ncbi:protein unc-45 homolog A-like [Juglans microcarpa x Juglans regia]|uniref:protein unc-45 homolog A-like n=1 Tax=Juglans microcarpa x Juglans regia TaxID=2249226 RepID=UPI001B7E15DD|nr:protein unc-45 homolog A-like [Juglans microcarpa x Juglans regia]